MLCLGVLLGTTFWEVATSIHHRRQLSELLRLVEHDDLTGALTRSAWRGHAVNRLARGETQVAIVDLDNFKDVNDTNGHAAGDQALIAVAASLTAAVGDTGHVSRHGGDEFAVVCDPAVDLAAAIRRSGVAASVGAVTLTPAKGAKTPDLIGLLAAALQDADRAMYEDKCARRDGGA